MWQSIKIVLISGGMITGLLFGCGERPGEKEFENGVRQFERQRLVRAKDLFEKSINKRPGHTANAFAYQYLGFIAWELEDATAAAVYFENSRRLNPQLFEPVYSLGVIAFEEGDWARARSHFVAASQLSPRDPRPLEYLAQTHRGQQARRDARRTLFEALARAPQSARILTALALIEFEEAGAAAAVSRLMEALEKNPQYAPALYNLGVIYASWPEQEDHAKAYFEQFIQVAPGSPNRERAERALARLRGEPVDEDEPLMAVRPAPRPASEPVVTPPPPRPRTLDEILADAGRLAEAGQKGQAMALCMRAAAQARQQGQLVNEERALRQAVSLDADSARIHLALGQNLMAQERPRDARAAFDRASSLEENWSPALIGMAESAAAMGDYDVSISALSRAVALEASDPDPLWSLATLYDETGVRRRAVETYRQFRERFGRDPRAVTAAERIQALEPAPPPPAPPPVASPVAPAQPARNVQAAQEAFRRAAQYQERRDLVNALFFYERAIQNDPLMEQAYFNAGVIHLERRDFREARDAFARSVEISPGKVAAQYNLGFARYELGERPQAVTHLEEALRNDPNFAPAHMLLGLIHADDPSAREQARRHYTRFLELRPNDPNAAAIRAWLAGQ